MVARYKVHFKSVVCTPAKTIESLLCNAVTVFIALTFAVATITVGEENSLK